VIVCPPPTETNTFCTSSTYFTDRFENKHEAQMALYTSKNHLSFIFLSDVFKVQTSRTSWFKRKEKFLLGFAWLILLLHLIRRCGDQNNNQMRKQSKNTIFIILGDFTITWASLTLQSKNVWHKNDLKLEMWNLLELIVASVPQDFH